MVGLNDANIDILDSFVIHYFDLSQLHIQTPSDAFNCSISSEGMIHFPLTVFLWL